MDELFGDVWDRTRVASPPDSGFSPRVDVYYCGEARRGRGQGRDPGSRSRGRHDRGPWPAADDQRRAFDVRFRGPRLPAGRDRGRPFRREIRSPPRSRPSAPASYEDGILRVELPLAGPVTRRVPIDAPIPSRRRAARSSRRAPRRRGGDSRARATPAAARGAAVLPLREIVAYPDTLTPLAVGHERSVRLIDDVLSGERMLVLAASRDPEIEEPGPEISTTSASPASSPGCSRCPTGRSGSSSRRPSGFGSAATSQRALPGRPHEPLPDVVEECPSSRR